MNMFFGATDALLDAGMAAESFTSAVIASDIGCKLLACHGFLQALYIQQDAVVVLSRAVGLNWSPDTDLRLAHIRSARNRLSGHPALAGEIGKAQRRSSAIIPYDQITECGFCGQIYYTDGSERIEVNASLFLKDNEDGLATQVLAIEVRMDDMEREFRTAQAVRPLSACFEGGFAYLVQRLRCQLDNDDRMAQAETHAKMIREKMTELKRELATRNFTSSDTSYSMERIFKGLDLVEGIIGRDLRLPDAQFEYDLICIGIEKQLDSRRETVTEFDSRLHEIV